jgi:hypothetical protein
MQLQQAVYSHGAADSLARVNTTLTELLAHEHTAARQVGQLRAQLDQQRQLHRKQQEQLQGQWQQLVALKAELAASREEAPRRTRALALRPPQTRLIETHTRVCDAGACAGERGPPLAAPLPRRSRALAARSCGGVARAPRQVARVGWRAAGAEHASARVGA